MTSDRASDSLFGRLAARLSRRTLFKASGALAGSAALASVGQASASPAAAQQVAPRVDGPLYFEQLGKAGTAIAFVHPAPMDHSCFLYQMAHLSTWFRTVAMDLPGWGKSPAAQPGVTADDLAQACWNVVDAAFGPGEPAIVSGLSIGSTVALHMAAMYPERTIAIALSGAGYTPGPKEYAPRRIAQYREEGIELRYEHTFVDFSPEFDQTDMARWIATVLTERNPWGSIEGIANVFAAVGAADPDELYTAIRSPMLIITGSQDNAFATAPDLQARVRGSELVVMEGAGHACNMERPWEWDAQLLAFLARRGLFSGESRWSLG